MDLNSLIILDKVASLGSFTAAAETLKMPNSNVSLKIKKLEEDLGHLLFTRSTRKVLITEFGQKVRNLAQPIIESREKIITYSEHRSAEPQGTVKISCPFDIGLHLMREMIPHFSVAFPKVTVDVDMSNRYVNIVEEGFDFAIRATSDRLGDSGTVALKLGETSLNFYAASHTEWTKINSISELEMHPILFFGEGEVRVADGESVVIIKNKSRVIVNDMAGINEAVLSGIGIGILPDFVNVSSRKDERLVKVLPEWSAGTASFYAICPSRKSLSPKNRAFLEFLKEFYQRRISQR